MIRVGDKVAHFLNMNRVGIVLEIIRKKNNKTWMIGGTASETTTAKIQFEDKTEELSLQDMFLIER